MNRKIREVYMNHQKRYTWCRIMTRAFFESSALASTNFGKDITESST